MDSLISSGGLCSDLFLFFQICVILSLGALVVWLGPMGAFSAMSYGPLNGTSSTVYALLGLLSHYMWLHFPLNPRVRVILFCLRTRIAQVVHGSFH